MMGLANLPTLTGCGDSGRRVKPDLDGCLWAGDVATMRYRGLLRLAAIMHFVALVLALLAGAVVVMTFRTMMAGGEPEAISMVFAIGLAAVPYCISGALHRMAEVEGALTALQQVDGGNG